MGKEGRKDVVVSRLVKDDQPSGLLGTESHLDVGLPVLNWESPRATGTSGSPKLY